MMKKEGKEKLGKWVEKEKQGRRVKKEKVGRRDEKVKKDIDWLILMACQPI